MPWSVDHPVRPNKKARRYSITCIRASQPRGIAVLVINPCSTAQPLAGRITPPVPTT